MHPPEHGPSLLALEAHRHSAHACLEGHLVASKRDADGRWALENVHPDELDAEPGVAEGQPSRWNTLHALRILRWAGKNERLL